MTRNADSRLRVASSRVARRRLERARDPRARRGDGKRDARRARALARGPRDGVRVAAGRDDRDGQGRATAVARARSRRAMGRARCARARRRSRARRRLTRPATTRAGTSARLALSAPPYSWRADLYDDVETRATTIERTAREVIFRCVKKVSKPWPRLTAVGAAEDVARRRADAERDAAADAERAEAERAMEKRRAARAFLEAQWAIDDRRAVAGARPPTPSVATEMRPARVARLPAFDAARLAKPPRTRVEIDVVFTPSARLPARRAS